MFAALTADYDAVDMATAAVFEDVANPDPVFATTSAASTGTAAAYAAADAFAAKAFAASPSG